jgi:hypothetical protein
MATTFSASPTLRALKDRQIAAAEALAQAQAEEVRASALVSEGREALSLGEIVAKTLHVRRNALARLQERTAMAEAGVRALEKAVIRQTELEAAAQRDAAADRERMLKARHVQLEASVATMLAGVEGEIVGAAGIIAESHAGLRSWAPSTDQVRERRWADATGAIRALRLLYPLPEAVTAIHIVPLNQPEEAPSA